jgi:perosamine synthetase
MHKIKDIAEKHNLFIIEDCAEAFGTHYHGSHVGGFGDIATYSFFGNKSITTGEGGMVVTNNEILYDRVTHLKGQGLAKNRQYWHDVIGYNYRMTNIAAAIGLAQLQRSDELLAKKRNIANYYNNFFQDTLVKTHQELPNTIHSYWMNSVIFDCDDDTRDRYRIILENKNIETRPLFYPVHTMPMYFKKHESHPIAETISRCGFNIPSYPELTEHELQYICECILELQ